MQLILRPGILFSVRFQNTMRYALSALFFTIPLGVVFWREPALFTDPWGWTMLGIYAVALYYHACFYAGAQMSWRMLKQIAKRIEANDLNPLPPPTVDKRMLDGISRGQFGFMLNTLQSAHAGLRNIVAQARQSAQAIAAGAGEIASGNANLSQRTEQQASTLEETASGMEELSGTVTQNADNCKLASELAQNAEKVARQGAQAVHGVVQGMGKIDQSSKRVADIIGVIEGIAFQTNILALNAAVEAARAGEQGRGFAVVAGEVRALAQRSAEAAKEIKALIELSVSQISDGSREAEGAGKVIDNIVVSVQQVNELIGEIAVASSQQSAGVGEINKAIVQLESVTQQNAALVEQASASSLTFQEQADRLRELVARFRMADEAAAPARPAAPQRASAKPARPATASLPKAKTGARPKPKPLPQGAGAVAGAVAGAGAGAGAATLAAGDEDEWKEF